MALTLHFILALFFSRVHVVAALAFEQAGQQKASELQDGSPINANSQPKAVFLHIPKTGGTLIEGIGMDAGVAWGRNMFRVPGAIQRMDENQHWCSSHHVPPHLLRSAEDAELYRGNRVFCVARHPYARALSEYSYRLIVKGVSPELFQMPQCSKEDLNNFIQQSLKTYKSDNPYVSDCHMLPQSSFIWAEDGTQQCHDVLHMERLEEEFNRLMSQHGIPATMDMKEKFTFHSRCPGLSVNDFTEDTLQLLDEVYKADLDKLGYRRFRRNGEVLY
eukprot:CAMPEP_0170641162 /NCGR_PEP_ID=MMETSP0224-20130122/40613_1 /TAXON_ID=285029 /ORGANISM="Togula jolla, Strain CCCM 725" /LENGTH=274 /DNA_ID=CAMNT_0010971721 /DNA_START=11 /DNA_END=838 /DNA_ORIENTATION=+